MKFIILAAVTFMVVGGQMMAPNNLNPQQTLTQPELENNGRDEIDPNILNHPLVQVANPMNSPMNIQQQYPANYLLTVLQYPVYPAAPMVPQTQDVTPMVTPIFTHQTQEQNALQYPVYAAAPMVPQTQDVTPMITPMFTQMTQEQDTLPLREPRRRYQNNWKRWRSWTTSGNRCKFPFSYNGQWHYQCTFADHHTKWCATSTRSDGWAKTWGNCART